MPLTSSWKQILELEKTCRGAHYDIWIMTWMLYLLLSHTTEKCFQGVKQQTWTPPTRSRRNLMTIIYLVKFKVVDIMLWFYMGMKRSEVCLDLTFNKGSISKLTSQKGLWNLNIHVNKTIIPPLTLNKSRTCKVSHYIRFFSQMNKNIILFNSIIPFWDPWDGGDDTVPS